MNHAKVRYLKADAAVQGHIHAGLRSAPQTKPYRRWFARRLAELQAERDEALAALVPEPRDLEKAAAGHPDNESTQAAQRLLAKRRQACATG